MASIKLYKKLKEIYNDKLNNVVLVTNSTLNIIDDNIEINLNGKPSSILINYTGAGIFESKMPIDIKVKISKNKILIVNTFKRDIPSIMFSFSGDINITNCQIMNFNGSKIASTINNNQKEQLLDKAKTNMEDDTLILYDEPKPQEVPAFKSGLIKPTISQNAINKFGKVQKYGKIEKETLVSAIRDFAPRVQKDAKYKPLKKAKQRIVKPIKPKPTKKEKPKYEGGKK